MNYKKGFKEIGKAMTPGIGTVFCYLGLKLLFHSCDIEDAFLGKDEGE